MSIFPLVRPLPFACSRVPSLRLLHLCPCNAGCQASVLSMRRSLLFSFDYIKFAPYHTSPHFLFHSYRGDMHLHCRARTISSATESTQDAGAAVLWSCAQLQSTAPKDHSAAKAAIFAKRHDDTVHTHTHAHTHATDATHAIDDTHATADKHIRIHAHCAHASCCANHLNVM